MSSKRPADHLQSLDEDDDLQAAEGAKRQKLSKESAISPIRPTDSHAYSTSSPLEGSIPQAMYASDNVQPSAAQVSPTTIQIEGSAEHATATPHHVHTETITSQPASTADHQDSTTAQGNTMVIYPNAA